MPPGLFAKLMLMFTYNNLIQSPTPGGRLFEINFPYVRVIFAIPNRYSITKQISFSLNKD